MVANVKLQSLYAVVLYYEPQLQRPKSAAQRHMPIAIFEHRIRTCRLISQILRQDVQAARKRFAIGHKKTATVEIREHPFVRIEAVTIRKFETFLNVPKFGTKRRRPSHGRVNMQPQL